MAATALPQAPDISAVMRKIRQQMGTNEAGVQSMGYDPQWERAASNAYGALGTRYSANDLSRQRLGQDYETNRANTMEGQQRAYTGTQNQFADRGTLFSGAYVDQQAKQNEDYTNQLSQLSRGLTRGTEDIDRSNAAALADYNRQIGDVETGYGQSVQKYLADQTQKQAQERQLEAQRAAQRALANSGQMTDAQRWAYIQSQI